MTDGAVESAAWQMVVESAWQMVAESAWQMVAESASQMAVKVRLGSWWLKVRDGR